MEHVVAAKKLSRFKGLILPLKYAANVIKTVSMADVFLPRSDFRVISGGTENHLFLVDVTEVVKENGESGAKTNCGLKLISLNKNSIPAEPCLHLKTVGSDWCS